MASSAISAFEWAIVAAGNNIKAVQPMSLFELTWKRLRAVRELNFTASSQAEANTGWSGLGQGVVQVDVIETWVMFFNESGTLTLPADRQINFTNVFRWTGGVAESSIRLEHLRFGLDRPVYLFDLVPGKNGDDWVSSQPHICREDRYEAQLKVTKQGITLDWTVRGPKKAETISYFYT